MSYDDLYAELPALDCKGLCAKSCGAIKVPVKEWDALREAVGHIPARGIRHNGIISAEFITDRKGRCPKLRSGRCTIYEHRPLPCRLWGMSERWRCPFGCEPERWLKDSEVDDLLRRAILGR